MAIIKKYSKDRKKCKVTFSLPIEAAPQAKDVRVVGDFNGWNWEKGLTLKLAKKEFTAQTELATGKQYQYRYQIDEYHWENDWAADAYSETPFMGIKNSVLILENGTKKVAVKAPAKAKTTAASTSKTTKKTPVSKTTTKRTAKKSKDFTVIEGVGPKINSLLQGAGLKSFEDLAKAKPAKIKEVLTKAGPRYAMHDPKTWQKQAKLAAQEKWEDLKKLQDTLKGGK